MCAQQTQVRVAIAGCHRMLTPKPGSHNFAAAFAAVPQTQVVAVFDLDAQSRDQFAACWRDVWGTIPTYGDYQAMLDATQADLLCVATRQTQHADQIQTAVQAGIRGVLCDKPLATSLTEMDQIVAACQNVPLAFALDRRWDQAYRQLHQDIAAGIIGPVTSAVAYGLPNTINHGCHWYDAVLALLDDPEPLWVSGLLDDVADEPADSRRRLDPSSRLQLGLDNGVVAHIVSDGPAKPSFVIVGAKGKLFVEGDASAAYLWREGTESPQALSLPAPAPNWPAGTAMVDDLVRAVKDRQRTACDIDQARRATEIGFAVHLSSAQDGAKIQLPAPVRTLQIQSFPWGNE